MINEANVVHYGKMKDNGEPEFYDKERFKQNRLELRGKEFGLIIFEKQEKVTIDQHGYMRGGIIAATCMRAEKFAGWNEIEIYNYFADMFFFVPVIKTFGEITVKFKKRLSMTTCGKKRASKFIDDTIRYLSEEGIEVLSPEEYLLGKYKTNDKTLAKLNSEEHRDQEQDNGTHRYKFDSIFSDNI